MLLEPKTGKCDIKFNFSHRFQFGKASGSNFFLQIYAPEMRPTLKMAWCPSSFITALFAGQASRSQLAANDANRYVGTVPNITRATVSENVLQRLNIRSAPW